MRKPRIGSSFASALAAVCLFSPSSHAADPPEPENARIRVVSPQGKPLAHADVDLSTNEYHAQSPVSHTTVQTDDLGFIHIHWSSGPARLIVNVKGVGYGSTWLTEVAGPRVVDVLLPPLAPYATIAGTIPGGEGAEVMFSGDYLEEPVKVTAGAGGRFTAEVHGGGWGLLARKGGVAFAESEHTIAVLPGDVVRGVKFKQLTLKEQVASTQPEGTFPSGPQASKTISWVEGTVSDEAGHPIAGATVYAAAVFQGAIRMYEDAKKATTDAKGHYAVKGPSGLWSFSATLVAFQPGMVPAMAWFSLPPEIPPEFRPPGATRAGALTVPRRDFVLTARGGRLDVVALRNEKPVAGAWVSLLLDGGSLRETWAYGSADAAQTEVAAIAYPTLQTGPDGVAHFGALPPGRYHILVSTDEDTARTIRQGFRAEAEASYATADSVAVRAGQTTTQRIRIYPQPDTATIRAFRQNGRPVGGRNIGITYAKVNEEDGRSSGINFDDNDIGIYHFDSPGLWHISLEYGTRWEPCYRANALLAVSPRLTVAEPARTTEMFFDTGSVDVEFRDVAGKPAHGVVYISDRCDMTTMIGSTDDHGRIRFEHIPPGKYVVKGHIAGQRRPALGIAYEGPLPEDSELTGTTFVPNEQVTSVPNIELHVILQARPAGYVRGFLRPSPGYGTEKYGVGPDFPDSSRGALGNYLSSTGEFVAGPFVTGKTTLYVGGGAEPPTTLLKQDVAIESGRVTTVELKPARVPTADSGGESILIGVGGQQSQKTGTEALAGRVYLADGKTPAFGATLFYYFPDDAQPHFRAATDVAGNIQGRGLQSWAVSEANDPPGSPQGPVIVAMLPGTCGATIIDVKEILQKPLPILLPNPVSVKGKLTLGGAKLTAQNGRFRVYAAYQGRGKLNGDLSVWATPQDDGSFELAGLTPGNYQVQAALDDIWLSSTVSVTVADDMLPPIALDIGQPGGAAIVQCFDAGGKPLPGAHVVVDRPAGPLASMYWPTEFIADGAGEAYVPALEAGKHRVRFKGDSASQEFVIKSLPANGPAMVKLQSAQPN